MTAAAAAQTQAQAAFMAAGAGYSNLPGISHGYPLTKSNATCWFIHECSSISIWFQLSTVILPIKKNTPWPTLQTINLSTAKTTTKLRKIA